MSIVTVNAITGEVTRVEPTPEEVAAALARTAAEAVPNATRAIGSYYATKLTAGFVYGGQVFQIDQASQAAINARATRALASQMNPAATPWESPHSDGWWDANNVVAESTMTVEGFLTFARAVSDYVAACAKCARGHKDALTVENAATYDYTTGWPT